jgi:hypothetical protein
LTEITEGPSGTASAGDEAANLYVAHCTFTNGPRTVSATLAPSIGTALAVDELALVAAVPSSGPSVLNSSTVNLPVGTTSKSASLGFTPASGNKLVAICAAGATFSVPSGWTRLSQRVDLWEAVVFTKTSDGTETAMAWTQNAARQAKVCFLEFASTATVSLQSAWAAVGLQTSPAVNFASATLSPTRGLLILARVFSGVIDAQTSHTYTTSAGGPIKFTDGASGTAGATPNEAANLCVVTFGFSDGPRTVSWTMTPSIGTALSVDTAQVLVTYP